MITPDETAIDNRIDVLIDLAMDGLLPHEQAIALIERYVNEVMSPVHRAMWLAEKIAYIQQAAREILNDG
jgi:hypothetical protein